jgi:hypothetical protein
MADHTNHFFSTRIYEVIKSLPQTDKERYFKMITDNEQLFIKLFNEFFQNNICNLPESLRNGVNNELVQEYDTWLNGEKDV